MLFSSGNKIIGFRLGSDWVQTGFRLGSGCLSGDSLIWHFQVESVGTRPFQSAYRFNTVMTSWTFNHFSWLSEIKACRNPEIPNRFVQMLLTPYIQKKWTELELPKDSGHIRRTVCSHYLVPIYFTCLAECCNTGLLWSSENVLSTD